MTDVRPLTFKPLIFDSWVRIWSCIPSVKYSSSSSPLRFTNGKTATDGRSSTTSSVPPAPLPNRSQPAAATPQSASAAVKLSPALRQLSNRCRRPAAWRAAANSVASSASPSAVSAVGAGFSCTNAVATTNGRPIRNRMIASTGSHSGRASRSVMVSMIS